MEVIVPEYNGTDTRIPRTLYSPLLNLLFAASILSKIAHGKAHLQTPPWIPYRPVFGYYHPHQGLPSLWYPIDPFLFASRLHASHTTNIPQVSPPLNQQQIIHIHEAPPLSSESENYEDTKNKYNQNINNYDPSVEGIEAPEEDSSSSNINQQTSPAEENNQTLTLDNMEAASTNNEMMENMYQSINVMYDKNETLPPIISLIMNRIESANYTLNEIPEPNMPYGKHFEQNRTIFENAEDQIAEENILMTINPTVEMQTLSTIPNENTEINYMDQEFAESSNEEQIVDPNDELHIANFEDNVKVEDLQEAAAGHYRRRQPAQNSFYDYDYEEEANSNANRRKQRPVSNQNQRRPQKNRPYKNQPERINSKRGQYRPLTTPYSEYDDYDLTTSRYNRKRTTIRRNGQRKRTSTRPSYEDYEDNRPYYNNRRKNNNNNNRRVTTPVYDDYYNDYERDSNYNYNNEEDEEEQDYDNSGNNNNNINNYRRKNNKDSSRQKDNLRPRQQTTTTEGTTETSSESSSTDTSSSSTTTTTTETTSTSTTESPTKGTTVGYPYPGPSEGYGPPAHPGYGPSNGNEHISITYGPPTGPIGPLLDSWYNQYAKTSVIKRIQDLLTPNNFYSPQYDVDKFNYNDMTIF